MVLLTIAIILIIITHAILLPRVHARVDVAMDHAEYEFHSIWFTIKGGTDKDSTSGRFLFFTFPKPEKRKQRPAKDKTKGKNADDKSGATIDTDDETSAKEPIKSSKSAPKKDKRKKAKKKSEKSGDSDKGKVTWAQFWEEKELVFDVLKRVVSGIVRFFKSIRTDYLDLRLELGLDDAMQTGILIGILHPLFFLQGKRRNVVIVPHYDEFAFDFAFTCSFSLRPIQVVNVFIIEAFKFPWRRSWLFVYRTWIKRPQKGKSGTPGNDVAVEVNT